MTPNDLIAAFDTLADAPDGVKRLRELLLSLAMRGKLVPQCQSERVASLSGRSRPGVGAATMEPPFGLPASWVWCRLDEIATYNGRPNAAPEDIPSRAWLLDLEDIEKSTSRLVRRATAAERSSRSNKSTFKAGDVLYGKLRPYLDKVLVAETDGYCTTEIVPIVPEAGVSSAWLRLSLKRPDFLAHVDKLSYGVKMPRLGTNDANATLHPLPPLAEQHRIVARVDELMGLLDRLEATRATRDTGRRAARDAALADLRDAPDAEAVEAAWARIARQMDDLFTEPEDVGPLRQAVLQLAVRGRLVPQDPGEEPASRLLNRVAAERQRRHGLGKIYNHPTHREYPGLSDVLPEGWAAASIEALTDPVRTVSYGILKPGDDVPNGIPVVKVKDIDHRRGVILSSELRRTTPEIHRQYLRSALAGGDVLVSIRGTVGKVAPVPVELSGGNITQDSARLAFIEPIDTKYLMVVMRSPPVQNYWASFSKGAAVQGLNIGDLRPTPIPLPPLAEQHRIVAKVDALMSLCDTLEARLTAARDVHGQFAAAAVHHLDA